MTNFTPEAALIGGLLIGCSAALLLIVNGRIAGISGIIGGLMQARPGDIGWRLAFLAGLLLSSGVYTAVGGIMPDVEFRTSTELLVLAGLLVGVGTRLAGGCTSGHGVCGIGRGSLRSIAATATFMATALLTVFVTRHLLGL